MQQRSSETSQASSHQALGWIINFSGVILLVLTLPLFILKLWTASIFVTIIFSLFFVGYALLKRSPIGSLDLIWLLFGLLNALLYFGFKSTILLQHLDTMIYSVLLAMVVISIIQGRPWTEQYARRTTPPEQWEAKEFHSINLIITIAWGIAFLLCDLVSLLFSGVVRGVLPALILVGLAVMTPMLARLFVRRIKTGQRTG